MPEPFWSDDFDMDLLQLLPDLPERLGDAANIPLWTYGNTSYGRLNHPSVWNGHYGHEAYFGTDDTGTWKPDGYRSHYDQIVACTWLEALRDAWPHNYMIFVDRAVVVWDTIRLQPTFDKLMYGLRGWRTLADGEADRLKGHLLASVLAATADLRGLLARKAGAL